MTNAQRKGKTISNAVGKVSFTFFFSRSCMSQVCAKHSSARFPPEETFRPEIYLFYSSHICRLLWKRVKCVSFHQHHISSSPYVNHFRSEKCFQSRFHITLKGQKEKCCGIFHCSLYLLGKHQNDGKELLMLSE